MNTLLINLYTDAAIENAILAMHTMYPYHFVSNGQELNELGVRDLAILAKRYRQHPGRLNVYQGNTPEGLYEARVKSIASRLAEMGVDCNLIRISDGLPGGDGMSCERIVNILEVESKNESKSLSSEAMPPLEAAGSE